MATDKFKFTDASLRKLPLADGKPYTVKDTDQPGLICRVTGASKILQIYKRPAGASSPVRVTLCKVGELPIKAPGLEPDVRKKASTELAKLAHGKNAAQERRDDRKQVRAQETVDKLSRKTLKQAFDDYIADQQPSAGTQGNYERAVRLYLSDWQDRPLRDIKQKDVLSRHAQLVKKSPSRANLAFRVLRAVINYFNDINADEPGFQPIHNPVVILGRRRKWAREEPRKTVIKSHQMPAWFQAIEKLRGYTYNAYSGELAADYFEFLLLTGLRRREATALTWDNVDFEDKSFLIPGKDTKNSTALALPLTERMIEILKRRKAAGGSKPFLLDDPRDAQKNVMAWSGVEWTPHALRRTFVTIAESLDVSMWTIKALVNHRSGQKDDVTGGYIQLNIERLREPQQKVTDRILHYAKHGNKTAQIGGRHVV